MPFEEMQTFIFSIKGLKISARNKFVFSKSVTLNNNIFGHTQDRKAKFSAANAELAGLLVFGGLKLNMLWAPKVQAFFSVVEPGPKLS